MKAVILNSGMGTRLYPLTRRIPKALLKIDSKPLLGHQVDKLIDFGINDLLITTGPFDAKIKNYIKLEYSDLCVKYVKNPKYRSTNYIYSMWLTRSLIDDDVVLLHGDLFFDSKLLKELLNQNRGNYVLVSREINPPRKDFKALIKNGRIREIGVEIFSENAAFLAPLYRFSKSDFLLWLNEIENSVKKGQTKIYAENVLNRIMDKISLYPVYFDTGVCMEIDTIDDLRLARDLAGNHYQRQ
jgi:choline kinase